MYTHTNLWAEKLQQVTLPDCGQSWQAMEVLLDREIPVGRKRDRRRWLLLILLLLLLIGICNCPGRGRRFIAGQTRVLPPQETAVFRETDTRAHDIHRLPSLDQPLSAGENDRQEGYPDIKKPLQNSGVEGARRHNTKKSAQGGDPLLTTMDKPGAKHGGQPWMAGDATGKPAKPKDSPPAQPANSPPAKPVDSLPVPAELLPAKPAEPLPAKPMTPGGLNKKPAPRDSTLKKPANDSSRKKPPVPPKPDKEKEKIRGFVAGLGLNQFFPVGGQQVSSYNSAGTMGTLSDYIPVPMGRYYFSKKLYIQLETQFNAPQYTRKNLVIQSLRDSLSSGRVSKNTVSVQKLFYFNVPLSVHFSPIDNLSIGAGLQFSRLRNAIGSVDSSITSTISTRIDSVISKHTVTLKTSTAYKLISTNEFRFLFDANYTYKHFILGLRYNQALSKFVNVQVGPGSVTQSRNSSLQIYLRYILWDGRKKN